MTVRQCWFIVGFFSATTLWFLVGWFASLRRQSTH